MTDVHVLGVRHHGPGSARAVAEALDELRPDLVLVEGPPELDALTGLVADPDLRPPVAALVYAADRPQLATFYPVADASPNPRCAPSNPGWPAPASAPTPDPSP